MGVSWERLAGDTSHFALKLTLSDDPDGGACSTRDESGSWGGFQIWIQGRNICAHTIAGEGMESVHWYLLPLLEWLARNWDPLLHEEKLPVKVSGDNAATSLHATRFPAEGLNEVRTREWESTWYDWWTRHSLLSCRRGGLFPNLYMRRWRDRIELSWTETLPPGSPNDLRFSIPQGSTRLPTLDVSEPMYQACVDATAELLRRNPRSTRLKALHKSFKNIKTTNEDVRLAWMAGLGVKRSQMTQRWRDVARDVEALNSTAAEIVLGMTHDGLALSGSCHAALMFGSVSPTLQTADVTELAAELVEAYDNKGDSPALRKLRSRLPAESDGRAAWEQGYRLAEQFLGVVGTTASVDWVDVDAILSKLSVRNRTIRLTDVAIRAVSIAGEQHRPTILINESYEANHSVPGLRFSYAHELCHLLFDRDAGQKLALASGPWAPLDIEQRANAFAAMLLMPTELVNQKVRNLHANITDLEGVRSIATSFRTSASATLEHLYNLGVIDEVTRERIRGQALESR